MYFCNVLQSVMTISLYLITESHFSFFFYQLNDHHNHCGLHTYQLGLATCTHNFIKGNYSIIISKLHRKKDIQHNVIQIRHENIIIWGTETSSL